MLARAALEWDLAILQHLTTPTTTEMPRGYELYEKRGGRLPDYAYDDWLENVLLFDDPDGCVEKIARLHDAGVRRLLLWMGPGGVAHDLLVRSMRLFAERVVPVLQRDAAFARAESPVAGDARSSAPDIFAPA